MTKREQLVKELNELHQEAIKLLDDKKCKSRGFKLNNIIKKQKDLQYEIDLLDGKVWDNEKWATSFSADDDISLENARNKLADMLRKMNGVEIENNKGVRVVYITTKYKVYRYEIHAHYGREVIGTETKKGMFGDYAHEITKPIFFANLKANGWGKDKQNWAWR